MNLLQVIYFLSVLVLTKAFTEPSLAESCSLERFGEYTASIEIGSRSIYVVGWRHDDDSEIDTRRSALDASLSSAQAGDCDSSRRILTEAVAALATSVEQKNYVLDLLETIHSIKPLKAVGLELTPSELNEGMISLQETKNKLDEIESYCGNFVQQDTAEIRELAQGPEITFALRYDGFSMLYALEDEATKAKNVKDFEVSLPFDFDDPRLNESHRDAISELERIVLAQLQPDESVFDRAVSFGRDLSERNQLKQNLKRSFSIVFQRIKGAYERNSFIAKNGLEVEGNMAIVVGSNHVEDLVQKLLASCN